MARFALSLLLLFVCLSGSSQEQGFSQDPYFRPAVVGFDLFSPLHRQMTISFEYIFLDGRLGLKLPLTIGTGDDPWARFDDKYLMGFFMNYYPSGWGKCRYFLGFGMRSGISRYDVIEYDYTFQNGYSMYNYRTYKDTGPVMDFLLNNGVAITSVKNLRIEMMVGIGPRLVVKGDNRDTPFNLVYNTNVAYSF